MATEVRFTVFMMRGKWRSPWTRVSGDPQRLLDSLAAVLDAKSTNTAGLSFSTGNHRARAFNPDMVRYVDMELRGMDESLGAEPTPQ